MEENICKYSTDKGLVFRVYKKLENLSSKTPNDNFQNGQIM
jgi:hypothetical protein